MLEKSLTWLRDYFTDQAKVTPQVLESFKPGKRKRLLWDPSAKKLTTLEMDRPDNTHVLHGVDSLIAYVNNLKSEARTNIWVGVERVTVEVVENDPKDVLTMPFRFHPTFETLRELVIHASLPQQEAIKLLRQRFAEFDPGATALTAIRNLKISTQDDFTTEQGHTAARLGKSLVQEAVGAGNLPESIEIRTPVFIKTGTVDVRTIRVWLSIDFANRGYVKFEPDEAQMEDAIIREKMELIGIIVDGTQGRPVAVYDGEYGVQG